MLPRLSIFDVRPFLVLLWVCKENEKNEKLAGRRVYE